MDEEIRSAQPRAALLGADITPLSEAEIVERIAALKEEIARLEAALVSKQASRTAADAAFRF